MTHNESCKVLIRRQFHTCGSTGSGVANLRSHFLARLTLFQMAAQINRLCRIINLGATSRLVKIFIISPQMTLRNESFTIGFRPARTHRQAACGWARGVSDAASFVARHGRTVEPEVHRTLGMI